MSSVRLNLSLFRLHDERVPECISSAPLLCFRLLACPRQRFCWCKRDAKALREPTHSSNKPHQEPECLANRIPFTWCSCQRDLFCRELVSFVDARLISRLTHPMNHIYTGLHVAWDWERTLSCGKGTYSQCIKVGLSDIGIIFSSWSFVFRDLEETNSEISAWYCGLHSCTMHHMMFLLNVKSQFQVSVCGHSASGGGCSVYAFRTWDKTLENWAEKGMCCQDVLIWLQVTPGQMLCVRALPFDFWL